MNSGRFCLVALLALAASSAVLSLPVPASSSGSSFGEDVDTGSSSSSSSGQSVVSALSMERRDRIANAFGNGDNMNCTDGELVTSSSSGGGSNPLTQSQFLDLSSSFIPLLPVTQSPVAPPTFSNSICTEQSDRTARLHQLRAIFKEHLPVPQTDDEYIPPKPKSTGIAQFYRTCNPPPSADADAWRSDSTTVSMYFELPAAWTAQKSVTAMASTTEAPVEEVANTEIHKRSVDGPRSHRRISAEESLIRAIIGPKGSATGEAKRRSRKNVQNLISAKLRLFKIGRDAEDKPMSPMIVNPPTSTSCNEPSEEAPTKIVLGTVSDLDPAVEKISVSIYWYVASVQAGQDKRKKLIASNWFAMAESRWVEFEVTTAVNYWIESGSNNGLYVQVMHEDGRVLDASKYFSTDPCNEQGQNMTQPPVLSRLMAAPLLEICSINSEASPAPAAHHRHRHHHGYGSAQRGAASGDASVTYEPIFSATSNSPTVIVPLDGVAPGSSFDQEDEISAIQSDVPQAPSTRFSLPPSHPLRHIISSVISGKTAQRSKSPQQQRVFTFDDFSSEESTTEDLDASDLLVDTSRSSSSSSSGRYRPSSGGHHRASKSTITISFTPSESRESSRESEVIRIQTGRDVVQGERR